MSPEVTYLRARYDEEAEFARRTIAEDLDYLPTIECKCGRRIHLGAPARQLWDVEAKRKILDLHEQWPVLLERIQPEPIQRLTGESLAPNLAAWVEWITTQEYRARFGDDPPTSSIIRAMLQPYADRDDFDPEWKDA